MINVSKAAIEDSGKYLLLKRKISSSFFPDQWDFPGGKIEQGENPKDAAIRETREETNLDVKLGLLVLEGDHQENERTIHYKIFLANYNGTRIKLGEDHTALMWVMKYEIEKYQTTPFVNEFFKMLKEK